MPRLKAVLALKSVIEKKYNLSEALLPYVNDEDKGLISELTYGVCRYFYSIEKILDHLILKPLKKKDIDLKLLMMLGIYQLKYLSHPDFAVVNETVAVAKKIKKSWATGLVNGTLRGFLREREEIQSHFEKDETYQYSFPVWLIKKIKAYYPASYQTLLKTFNERAPLVLRVNKNKIDADRYFSILEKEGHKVSRLTYLCDAIELHTKVKVSALPFYTEGYFSIQDAGAQFSALLLELLPAQRVLDACSAPGGKLTHILESGIQFKEMLALDNKESRLLRIQENLTRLGLGAAVRCADAADTQTWWDRKCYDRILLDAPCSATGIIRRHPEIKLLRTKEAVQNVCLEQQRLLDALWPLLSNGGVLLYVTCSILNEENDLQIKRFLSLNSDASLQPFSLPIGSKTSHGWQLLPPESDGFYYARLKKVR
jgi:16S rRNA (cytosine967-C5)-methyltransferase